MTDDSNNSIIVGYLDDNKDNNLNKYLEKKFSENYFFIQIDNTDTIKSAIQKILEKRCCVVILDSKLYTDSGKFTEKITGQNMEVVLTSFYPFISTIVISQEKDVRGLNYIKKYDGSSVNNSDIENYYHEKLGPILQEYINKQSRLRLTYQHETSSSNSVDLFVRDSINETINNLPIYNISKQDIDKLIEMIGDLENKLCG